MLDPIYTKTRGVMPSRFSGATLAREGDVDLDSVFIICVLVSHVRIGSALSRKRTPRNCKKKLLQLRTLPHHINSGVFFPDPLTEHPFACLKDFDQLGNGMWL